MERKAKEGNKDVGEKDGRKKGNGKLANSGK